MPRHAAGSPTGLGSRIGGWQARDQGSEERGPDAMSDLDAMATIDERTELLARLRDSQRNLEEAERIARVGSWTLDPATGEATWSRGMYYILGRDPDGSPLRLEEISALFTADSVRQVTQAVDRAVATGEPWRMDLELLGPDGPRGWATSIGVPDRDAAGGVRILRGTMQDVTDHRRLEGQLRQAQRLEAVGQLAGGIAHDFNNILTAIRGFSEVALVGLGPHDPNRADLEQVVGAADRAATLVRQLLAFSRRQVLQPRVVDPGEVIEDLLPLVRRLLGEAIEVAVTAEPGLGRINVDPGQLEQVIVNLAVNAGDAMAQSGSLSIELTNVALDAPYVARHPEASPGPHVCIAVTDTGHGMDPETQARAFEPFFTTKGPDRGTGMGLATVYGIVKQSGGSIYLYSESGRGTTFKLYFPRADEQLAQAEAKPEALTRRAGRGETILLVEDDAAVRAYARRVLVGDGYQVIDAPSGPDALVLADAHPGTIDLLMTDAIMPAMHGVELAERIAAARPGIRVLYVSGFTENSVIQHGVVRADVAFLPKPFGPADLAAAVRSTLDRRR